MGARYTARASAGQDRLYLGNAYDITVDCFADRAAPATPISDAALAATLVDPQGVNVPDAVGIALAAVSGTPGSYLGVVPASVTATLIRPATLIRSRLRPATTAIRRNTMRWRA